MAGVGAKLAGEEALEDGGVLKAAFAGKPRSYGMGDGGRWLA
jgi:hypothetical protein